MSTTHTTDHADPLDAPRPSRRSRSRSRGRWLAVPVVSVLLLAAACGGSSSDDGTADGDSGGGAESGFAATMAECPVDALDGASGPVEITMWEPLTAKPKEGFAELVAEFNASQDEVILKSENQGTYGEMWDKYQQAAGANALPNIAMVEDVNAREVAESGLVIPAQSCIDADDTDTSSWMASAVSYYSIDGALVPGTASLSSPVLYYNKNHFRAAGLDPEVAPTNLDELRDYAQELKDAGVTDKPLSLYLHPWFIDNWLTGVDTPVVNNDNGHGDGETTESTFDNPQSLEIYTWIKGMADDGLANVIPYDGKSVDHYLAVQSQASSMLIETSTASVSVKALLVGDTVQTPDGEVALNTDALDVGVGPFPGLTEPGKVMIGGNATFMTLTGTPEQQAASWAFIKWFNSAPVQARWNHLSSYIPFNQDAVEDPEIQNYWDTDMIGPWLRISYDQLSGVSVDNPGPTMGPFSKYRDSLRDTLASLLTGADPAAAIATTQSETTQALTDYNEGGF